MPERPFFPKKRLGQCFLIDANITRKIIAAASLNKDDVVLEIGPGKGALTSQLSTRVKKLIAVELDKYLYQQLNATLDKKNTILINKDILAVDLRALLAKLNIKRKITVVANIPYSITSEIIAYIFESVQRINAAFLMVQKEFAQRLIAQPRTEQYSSLSCFAQYHADVRILFDVSRHCFRPQPKVDSCFIVLYPRQRNKSLAKDLERILFKVIRSAFNQRRKMIVNALADEFNKDALKHALKALGFDCRRRAQEFSLAEFIELARYLCAA